MNVSHFCTEDLKSIITPGRMSSLIREFVQIGGDTHGGVTRVAFSREDIAAREKFIGMVESELHLKAHIDALGNIFVHREGVHSGWPVIMTGSHLDTVRNGGPFDGPAGVLSAFEVFRAMDRLGIQTNHPLELAVFCSEEPNGFGISTFGSRGMTGKLTVEEVEHLSDEKGRKFRDALACVGGDIDRLGTAIRKPGEIECFVELHIEQMPHLDRSGTDIGVVTGVTGIYREHITITGKAAHCGTTPMNGRQDALVAAAEIILALEFAARQSRGEGVATVGRMTLYPNSINVTTRQVELDADIRSFFPETTRRIIGALDDACPRLKAGRDLHIERKEVYETKPVSFAPEIRETIRDAASSLGFSSMDLISMAGHDAAHLSVIANSGMIFIPCAGGVSHCPEEWTAPEDLAKGSQCLLLTLLSLDARSGSPEGK